jgi:hypothetical protein
MKNLFSLHSRFNKRTSRFIFMAEESIDPDYESAEKAENGTERREEVENHLRQSFENFYKDNYSQYNTGKKSKELEKRVNDNVKRWMLLCPADNTLLSADEDSLKLKEFLNKFKEIFKNPSVSSLTQSGALNNINDFADDTTEGKFVKLENNTFFKEETIKWFNDNGYKILKGADNQQIICIKNSTAKPELAVTINNVKYEKLSTLKNGIKTMDPIYAEAEQPDGSYIKELVGVITVDGDGDVGQKFANGEMEFTSMRKGTIATENTGKQKSEIRYEDNHDNPHFGKNVCKSNELILEEKRKKKKKATYLEEFKKFEKSEVKPTSKCEKIERKKVNIENQLGTGFKWVKIQPIKKQQLSGSNDQLYSSKDSYMIEYLNEDGKKEFFECILTNKDANIHELWIKIDGKFQLATKDNSDIGITRNGIIKWYPEEPIKEMTDEDSASVEDDSRTAPEGRRTVKEVAKSFWKRTKEALGLRKAIFNEDSEEETDATIESAKKKLNLNWGTNNPSYENIEILKNLTKATRDNIEVIKFDKKGELKLLRFNFINYKNSNEEFQKIIQLLPNNIKKRLTQDQSADIGFYFFENAICNYRTNSTSIDFLDKKTIKFLNCPCVPSIKFNEFPKLACACVITKKNNKYRKNYYHLTNDKIILEDLTEYDRMEYGVLMKVKAK